MPSLRALFPAIRLAIACLVLALGLRTWLVMGLIEPVTVAGSSMVPTLRGAFVTPTCPRCLHTFSVGAEFAGSTEVVACPQCAEPRVPLSSLPRRHGDRLWVDRIALGWRLPQRWEVVVARNPTNGAELCVKRVVGLPGETVSLRDGNVQIDGATLVKTFDERHALRQKVHHENLGSQRWQPDTVEDWLPKKSGWQHRSPPGEAMHWLRYQHPGNQPLTDDVTYNAGLTRRWNLVDEFMLSADLSVRGEGTFSFALDDGTATAQVDLHLPTGKMTVQEGGRHGNTVQLSPRGLERLARGQVRLEFSNFDQQLLLTIDGQVQLRRPWPNTKAAGTDRPLAIGAQGVDIWLGNLILYRDIYHSPQAVNAPPPLATRWQLGPDEYFLLGDNAPVSLDSRLWGPVPARLLVGKLLGER